MKPGEIAVLFRNNHFFVVTFQNDVMYSLITDQGYLHSPELVWEGELKNRKYVIKLNARTDCYLRRTYCKR